MGNILLSVGTFGIFAAIVLLLVSIKVKQTRKFSFVLLLVAFLCIWVGGAVYNAGG